MRAHLTELLTVFDYKLLSDVVNRKKQKMNSDNSGSKFDEVVFLT